MRRGEAGFTMIELLIAMTVFSFMLVIIVVGFMNVIRLRNQALASNMAQDNARTALAEMVRAVRDSSGVVTPVAGTPASQLCLASASGPQRFYYVGPADKRLYRADDCTTPTNIQAVTSSSVMVANFVATMRTMGATILKPEVNLTITMASNNGTTTGSGAATSCGPNNADRMFCATVTLSSGAVPR